MTSRALDADGLRAVREGVTAVGITLEEVRQHLREGVTGVGLEDALLDLERAAHAARRTYDLERARRE